MDRELKKELYQRAKRFAIDNDIKTYDIVDSNGDHLSLYQLMCEFHEREEKNAHHIRKRVEIFYLIAGLASGILWGLVLSTFL